MISLTITGKDGSQELSQMVQQITWSGDYRQCSRKLEAELFSTPPGKRFPELNCDVGAAVRFSLDGRLLFSGFVISRTKSTSANTVSILCYDQGFYLKKNKGVYKFKEETPEGITRRVCSDFGIPVGELAATGVTVTRNFIGVELYKIIMTAYTLASEKDKKRYLPVFRDDRLTVIEKKVTDETLVLEGGANLMEAACTESVENMVNQVAIYDENDSLVRNVQNPEAIKLYGLMQEYLKQGRDGEDVSAKAETLLEDRGYEQRLTVQNLGDPANVTGGTVVVKEPYTGVCGLFYIDTDVHTWKNGQYLNKLTLNFKNIMDKAEAGSLPNADRRGAKR